MDFMQYSVEMFLSLVVGKSHGYKQFYDIWQVNVIILCFYIFDPTRRRKRYGAAILLPYYFYSLPHLRKHSWVAVRL